MELQVLELLLTKKKLVDKLSARAELEDDDDFARLRPSLKSLLVEVTLWSIRKLNPSFTAALGPPWLRFTHPSGKPIVHQIGIYGRGYSR